MYKSQRTLSQQIQTYTIPTVIPTFTHSYLAHFFHCFFQFSNPCEQEEYFEFLAGLMIFTNLIVLLALKVIVVETRKYVS